MKKILETMYILTPDSYLYHRNENICVSIAGQEKASVPAKDVDSIVFFGKNTLSTSLLSFCGEREITLTFLDPNGRFYGTVSGALTGNVLLRKRQYDSLHDETFCRSVVSSILYGKLLNSKNLLLRHGRTEKSAVRAGKLYHGGEQMAEYARKLNECADVDSMRGVEGAAGAAYFACFDQMLSESGAFRFGVRSRRPPANEVNAVLSFLYVQMTHDMRSALEGVGLDPYAGYLHTLRPGRPSLALDLIEELRSPLCDRLTLTLFNRGQLSKQDFQDEGEGVYLNEKGRRRVLQAWRERKHEEIRHPFLDEKLVIGMIAHVQAVLLARALRGALDRYPPFVWR